MGIFDERRDLNLPLHGKRVFLNRFDSRRKPGKHLNPFHIYTLLIAPFQKIQCTFKHDIPDMGHLGGGSERDVMHNILAVSHPLLLNPRPSDNSTEQNADSYLACLYYHLFVRLLRLLTTDR